MTPGLFRIQTASGLFVAPAPSRLPFVEGEAAAAIFALPEATQKAEALMASTGMTLRLVSAGLEFDFKQSVDFPTN